MRGATLTGGMRRFVAEGGSVGGVLTVVVGGWTGPEGHLRGMPVGDWDGCPDCVAVMV